jgi:glycosyltransferase involved in cell wall biosynthesis
VPRILFHRHTPWQSEVRCSTNIYASLFAQQGYGITYMQGIVHPGNVLMRRGQWESWQRGPRRDGNAWVFTPLGLAPFAKRWPFDTVTAAKLSYLSCVPSIRAQVLRGECGAPDVIWSANPGSIALREIFPEARFVFQAVDFYPAFSGPRIKSIERADYQGADHIFVIGETLKRYICSEHGIDDDKVTVLGQGAFNEAYRDKRLMPEEIADLPRPLGIWVGVLSKGDPELFGAAAAALKKIGGSLVLIGPDAEWTQSLCRRYTNTHVIGARPPEAVPAYLQYSDFGLMLYDRKRQAVYKGQNPLKLYEYAAAGLPIVSTPHDEFAYLDPPVVTVNTERDVFNAIGYVLKEKISLRIRALEFSAQHSWSRAFDIARTRIESLLQSQDAKETITRRSLAART